MQCLKNKFLIFFSTLIAFVVAFLFSSSNSASAVTVWNTMTATTHNANYWKLANGASHSEVGWWKLRLDTENGAVVFCTDIGVMIPGGTVNGYAQKEVSDAQHQHLSVIAYYGYYSNPTLMNEEFTQYLIWEALGSTMQSNTVNYAQYQSWKANVMAKVNAYEKRPSFAETTDLQVIAGKSDTITDANNSLSTYTTTAASAPKGITATLSGDKLSVTADASAESGMVTFNSNIPSSFKGVPLVYTQAGMQSLFKPALDLASKAFSVKVNVIHPDEITIQKKDDANASLSGIKFVIADTQANLNAGNYLKLAADGKTVVFPGQSEYSSSLKDYMVITDADGMASWHNMLRPGASDSRTYYFKELNTDSTHQLATHTFSAVAVDEGTTKINAVVNDRKPNLPKTGSKEVLKFGKILVGLLFLMMGSLSIVVVIGSNKLKTTKGKEE